MPESDLFNANSVSSISIQRSQHQKQMEQWMWMVCSHKAKTLLTMVVSKKRSPLIVHTSKSCSAVKRRSDCQVCVNYLEKNLRGMRDDKNVQHIRGMIFMVFKIFRALFKVHINRLLFPIDLYLPYLPANLKFRVYTFVYCKMNKRKMEAGCNGISLFILNSTRANSTTPILIFPFSLAPSLSALPYFKKSIQNYTEKIN